MLRLHVFGRFRVEDDQGNEIPIKSRKARALLAYLASPPGKPRSRDAIAALLWSDRGDEQARGSLRQALSGLRHDLGDDATKALLVTHDDVILNPEHVVVESLSPGDEFLEGLQINDPAFDEWLRDERQGHATTAKPDLEKSERPPSGRPSIAILPFKNLTGDPEQEYLSDGVTEDIITALSRFREFDVMARHSSFHFRDEAVDPQEVRREIGVRYVVEGSVRKTGGRLRVTAQLIDADSGTHIWADRYDRDFEDIFNIQDEITEAVVARVADRVKVDRARSSRSRPSQSATAYDLVLQARPYQVDFTPAGNREAERLLRRAIEMDPQNAEANASLAFTLGGTYEEGWARDPGSTLEEALICARHAVAIDDSNGYAHASLAYVMYLKRDFDKADYEANKALRLNPNHTNIIMTRGWISIVLGDHNAAIEQIQRARELNPYMPGFELSTLGTAYFDGKRYKDAIRAFSQVTDPPMWTNYELAASYAYLGDEKNAARYLHAFLARASRDLARFPGNDDQAWRSYFESHHIRRDPKDLEHLIEGLRKAGLAIA